MRNSLHFSTGNDEHDTPADVFEPIATVVGGFDLDPCASATSDLATTNWTKDDDGLSMDWYGKVWVNPPYSQLTSHDWNLRMAAAESNPDIDVVVGLVPNRTSTQWYHNSVPKARLVCHVEGRLKFGDSENSAPFPSAIVMWGGKQYTDQMYDVFDGFGAVFEP